MLAPTRAAPRKRLPPQGLLLALIVMLAGAVAPGHAFAWWNKDWPYRKQITLDTSAKGLELHQPVGRAPLLVRLHSGNFKFDDSQENGADLRFVAGDDKTPLAYHIESFDPLLGVAAIWVDVPKYPVDSTQTIWMYYGSKKAASAADTTGSFDPDYVAAYHFDAATGAAPKDKTAYGNNAQTAPAAIDEAGVIGKSARFTGADPMLIGASPSLAMRAGAPFTFSAWVRLDAPQPQAAIYARRDGGASVIVGVDQAIPFAEVNGQRFNAATALAVGQWTHIAFVSDGRSQVLYVNGKPVGTGQGPLPALNTATAIGGDAPSGALKGFQGGLDEVRLSRVARSPALVQMDAGSQGAQSRLIAFNADEKQSGGGFGYFGVIFKNVTPDAWAVIAILGVMSLISWVVMYVKGGYVGRVVRGNQLFDAMFSERRGEVLSGAWLQDISPREREVLAHSPLHRIYAAGVAEFELAKSDDPHGALAEETVEAIRASLDAAQVAESQKLNRWMVLLTIAISGGPFIGLLGTVLGVMITFAAIALAGDVNVNAIAPGVAAALLATVTGLFVAIPALFGYNYIASRNAEVTAGMQVFVDRLITRFADLHRRALRKQALQAAE